MRRAARRLVRGIAFALLRISRAVERRSRSLALASFTAAELDTLSVAEWEAFGEAGTAVGDELFFWETDLFAKHIRKDDSILVVGAGTGRDVIPLLAAGHAVTALDITPRALATLTEKARRRGLGVTTIHSSIVEAELPQEAFEVVFFSWFSFNYLRGPLERRAALLRSRATLKKGGRMVLSYAWRKDARSAGSSTTLGRRAARWLGGIETEPGDEFNVTGSPARPSVYFEHVFDPEEIEAEVRGAGLTVVSHARPTSGTGVLVLVRNLESAQ